MHLAERFPRSQFHGYDLSQEAIAWARAEAGRRRLKNAVFEVRDLSDFDLTGPVGRFDLVTTFDAIHDQAKPGRMLAGIRRALRPDGVFLAQDIKGSSLVHENASHPIGTFLYTVSCMHCMTVSLALDGAGLGTAWGWQLATSMLADAGFTDVRVAEIESDPLNNYYIARK